MSWDDGWDAEPRRASKPHGKLWQLVLEPLKHLRKPWKLVTLPENHLELKFFWSPTVHGASQYFQVLHRGQPISFQVVDERVGDNMDIQHGFLSVWPQPRHSQLHSRAGTPPSSLASTTGGKGAAQHPFFNPGRVEHFFCQQQLYRYVVPQALHGHSRTTIQHLSTPSPPPGA
jgi:hypothetical protein